MKYFGVQNYDLEPYSLVYLHSAVQYKQINRTWHQHQLLIWISEGDMGRRASCPISVIEA
jgi:hypothetical protein